MYNNLAAAQVQNDVYGELLLALNPIFCDERFHHLRTPQLEQVIHWLAQKSINAIGQPDAGIWELRNSSHEHSFTNLISWAGLDRVAKMIKLGTLTVPNAAFASHVDSGCQLAVQRLTAATVDGSLRNSPQDTTHDASLLLLSALRYPDEKLRRKTLDQTIRSLAWRGEEHYLLRYNRSDDFGVPEHPFLICSFWLVQSLAREGQIDRGIEMLRKLTRTANHLGLLSEHYAPDTNMQLGNFPQCYSHVGMINAAFAVSPKWEEIL
jgi:GH15 family glucan-1,4-alpha-glucosidase